MSNPGIQVSSEAVYVHVPFCRAICGYCDFKRQLYKEDLADKWLKQIDVDLSKVTGPAKRLYLCGGTPSALNKKQLETFLSSLDHLVPLNNGEYTTEANPENLTLDKIKLFKQHGVNRVSLGVQSFHDQILKTLERVHHPDQVIKVITELRNEGITNISIDLMYSLPGQTLEDWKEDLRKATSLKVQHISLYSLTIEENSRFGKEKKEPLDNDCEFAMYKYAIEYLTSCGYLQYEISNFALPNYESKHNLAYWHYEDFVGVGLGAAGKKGHIRYTHVGSLEDYLAGKVNDEVVKLSDKDVHFEAIMMGLRLNEGIERKDLISRFGFDPVKEYPQAIKQNLAKGYLVCDDKNLKVTTEGRYLLNEVLEDFLE